jgi:hypothetical protein
MASYEDVTVAIRGPKGDPGTPGTNGSDGLTPEIGANGNWFIGGVDTGESAEGEKGDAGESPTIGANGNWFIDGVDTGLPARGAKGDTGDPGDPGEAGTPGVAGDPGPAGPAGPGIYSGASDPTPTQNSINDQYVNTSTGDVFIKTANDTWTKQGNIKGADGTDGTDGANGETPTIEITDGKWVINGTDTGIYAAASRPVKDSFTADGTTQTFVLTEVANTFFWVKLQTATVLSHDVPYTFNSTTKELTLIDAVSNGDVIEVMYLVGTGGMFPGFATQAQLDSAVNESQTDRTNINNDLQTAKAKYDGLIPSAATTTNQLADKNFVNSSITNTAANRVYYDVSNNPFPTRAAIVGATTFYREGAEYTPTKNDYAIIEADEGAPSPFTNGQTRWQFDGTAWAYDFGINNQPFTAAEAAALASGITSQIVTDITNPNTAPTSGSTKMVTSGGIFSWFGAAVSTLTTTAKNVVGAINELVSSKQNKITANAAAAQKVLLKEASAAAGDNPVEKDLTDFQMVGAAITLPAGSTAAITLPNLATQDMVIMHSPSFLGAPGTGNNQQTLMKYHHSVANGGALTLNASGHLVLGGGEFAGNVGEALFDAGLANAAEEHATLGADQEVRIMPGASSQAIIKERWEAGAFHRFAADGSVNFYGDVFVKAKSGLPGNDPNTLVTEAQVQSLIASVMSSNNPLVIALAPWGHWSFDNWTGGDVLVDDSGNGRTFTTNANQKAQRTIVPYTPAKYGQKCIRFTGTIAAAAQVPALLLVQPAGSANDFTPTSFTLAMWINCPAGSRACELWSNRNNGGFSFNRTNTTGNYSAWLWMDNTYKEIQATATDGAWHFIVIKYNNEDKMASMKFDNVGVGTSPSGQFSWGASANFVFALGGNPDNAAGSQVSAAMGMNQMIDEVWLFDRITTDAEDTRIFNNA